MGAKRKPQNLLGLNCPEDIDKKMVKEAIANYSGFDYSDLVCLDLGANIGAFAKIALEAGAKRVICVECDKRNVEILKGNLKEYGERVVILEGAVSGQDITSIKIYKSKSKSNHCSVSTKKRTHGFEEYDEVENFHILDLMDDYKPELVKIDIEGGEFEFVNKELMKEIDFMYIELHQNSKTESDCDLIISQLKEVYEDVDVKPNIYFNAIGGYDCFGGVRKLKNN